MLRNLCFTLALAPLGVALAHAELVGSSPEDGATVTEPLTEVVLSFSGSVALDFSTFKVYPLPVEAAQAAPEVGASHGEAPAGDEAHAAGDHGHDPSHASGADAEGAVNEAAATLVAQVLPLENDEGARVDTGAQADGVTVTLSLQDALPAGNYVVMWRAPSEDGHPVEGFITFTYDPAA